MNHRALFFSAALVVTLVGRLAAEPPRLAVVISIDQCRYDYLERFWPFFGPGGFKRLLEGGAVFENCHYRQATTTTAVGHATILSGVYPEIHGIVNNEWFAHDSLERMAAVNDKSAPVVGAAPRAGRSPGAVLEGGIGRSPRNYLATTVGDQLKLRYGASSRVVAVANKDRAAILLGGRLADHAYWIEESRFVTSRYYREALPDWVESFNGERRMEKDFGREWTPLLDAKIYDEVQGPDDAPGEESRLGLGVTFPRRVDGGQREISRNFYQAYDLTPFYTEMLGEFAQRAVHAEQLGRHPAPDLLCIGFSQIDYMGHSFGPDSHEMMDSFLKLDRVMAGLLEFLDKEVGPGRYVVVMTADHGSPPLPERVKTFNRDVVAGRFDKPAVDRLVTTALTEAFGAAPENEAWIVRDNNGYHLRTVILRAKNVNATAAAIVVKSAVLRSPQIASAFTREELQAAPAEGDSVLAAVRRSFFAERSPDVMFVLKPYVTDRMPAGTNHGSPYDYDNHVPLLWYGTGVHAGVRPERVGMESLAPTLSSLLGLPPPPQAAGPRLF